MEAWADDALLLAVRRHGEADAIVELFTAARGRHGAVVKGGAGRRLGPALQPGATLAVEWRARLADHLGVARVEPARARAGAIMVDAAALAALSSAAALILAFTAEREPHPALYAATEALFDRLAAGPGWEPAYAAWELGLLAELGFALDLSACALTGATEDLAWVSPRTGRAVAREAGAPWADKLLPLPGFLIGAGAADAAAAAAALRLTGHFLDRLATEALGAAAAPPARARLIARLAGRADAQPPVNAISATPSAP